MLLNVWAAYVAFSPVQESSFCTDTAAANTRMPKALQAHLHKRTPPRAFHVVKYILQVFVKTVFAYLIQ